MSGRVEVLHRQFGGDYGARTAKVGIEALGEHTDLDDTIGILGLRHPFCGTMQTRRNRWRRIDIVLWGSHFVEYISNIDGERIFCDCSVCD